MSPPPPFRLSRAAIFAVVCVSLTMAAHAAVSHPVPVGTALLAGLPVLAVAWALGGHERSPVTILGGLLGGQFGLHTLFAAAQPVVDVPAHVGHGQPPGPVPIAPSGVGMTLAHVAAAVVCAWWLLHGERTAWSLARRIAAMATLSLAWASALFEPAPPARPVIAPPAVRVVARQIAVLLRHSVVLRGPPSRSPVLGCG